MMGVLSQIAATFLVLFLTLLVVYIVFLSTSRTNFDAEIQAEGYKIANILRSVDIVFNSPHYYSDAFLLATYQSKHPQLSRLELLEKIVDDLVLGAVHHSTDLSELYRIAERGNRPGRLPGRIALWIVKESVFLINSRPAPTQEMLFPFGPLGVESWLRDFNRALRNVRIISSPVIKEILLNDLQQFIDNTPENNTIFGQFDYRVWLGNTRETVEEIESHTSQIVRLLRLRDTFSIKARLPNINWFLMLASMLLCMGIIIPLGIIGLGLESSTPPAVNITIMFVVVLISLGIGWLLRNDLTTSPERHLAQIRYFIPLRDQILAEQRERNSRVTFDIGPVNVLLEDTATVDLSRKDRRVLEDYRNAVGTSNAASERMSGVVESQLRSSAILARYVLGELESSNTTLPILMPLGDAGAWGKFSSEMRSGIGITIQDNRGHVTSEILKLRLPASDIEVEQVRMELSRIYRECESREEHTEFTNARHRLAQMQQHVLAWLNQKIESKRG
jgi:hypothetical protein